jgi:hypothetical protein
VACVCSLECRHQAACVSTHREGRGEQKFGYGGLAAEDAWDDAGYFAVEGEVQGRLIQWTRDRVRKKMTSWEGGVGVEY